MDLDQAWIGIVRGAYYLPVTAGFALAARHGRYLPIWLPECGMIAAYASYYLVERAALPFSVAVLLALLAGSACAAVLHRCAFARHVDHAEPFAALLGGIGLIVVLDNGAALLTGGYALAFTGVSPSLHQDAFVVIGALALCLLLSTWIEYSQPGLVYRAVSINRGLAQQYGLAVRRTDLIVLVLAGLLCAVGGLSTGLRYGLTPTMMSANALKAAAVIVTFGADNLLWVVAGTIGIGVLESLCQSSARFSAFESGVSYGVLAIGLFVHYLFAPWWSSVRDRSQRSSELQPGKGTA